MGRKGGGAVFDHFGRVSGLFTRFDFIYYVNGAVAVYSY